MKDNISSRKIAVDSIYNIIYNDSFSDIIVRKNKDLFTDNRDFTLYQKIVLGSLERIFELDFIISELSNIKFNKIDKIILSILRCAIYELMYLESKDYAVINEYVNLTVINKRKFSKGYVNAILRNFLRNKNKLLDNVINSTNEQVRYNINQEIIDYFKLNYSNYDKILMSFYDINPLTVRANKDIDLSEEVLFKKTKYDNFYLVKDPQEFFLSDYFKNNKVSIQSLGSYIAGRCLDAKDNNLVLDLCSAPGTKARQILDSFNGGHIVSNDIDKNKNRLIEENLKYFGKNRYEIRNFDATVEIKEFREKFDRVLIDVPCSNLGLISKKPEIRFKRTMNYIYDISNIQKKIIDCAIKYLKVGGVLVYSTCTYGNLENLDNYNYLKSILDVYAIDNEDYIQIDNYTHKSNGFFIARFKKVRWLYA